VESLEPLISSGHLLLTPNARLARSIKAEWDTTQAARGERVWQALDIKPLETWLLGQWQLAVSLGLLPPATLLSAGQAQELWQQVIAQQESEWDDYHLLRPSGAAELASEARTTLLRWGINVADPGVRQSFALDRDCNTYLAWHLLFEQRMSAANMLTAPDCINQLCKVAAQLPAIDVALLEFDDIPPLYTRVLQHRCAEVVHVAPASAGTSHRYAHAFEDHRSELRAVADWAATTYQQQPEASIAIVVSDMRNDRVPLEYLLRRAFDAAGENYTSLPVNFSTGIALDQAPVIRDALAILAMTNRRCALPQVLALLRSRFVMMPDADSALAAKFVERLLQDGHEWLDIADLRYRASEIKLGEKKGLVLGQYLMSMAGKRELNQRALPSQWTARLEAVLAIWGWPGSGTLDSMEYQQVELWYQTLDEFRAYDVVSGPLDLDAALSLLRSSCATRMSQPKTSDSRLQVLGPLEAAGLSFDQLWLCGAQGNRWPAPVRPNPFIPNTMQRSLDMPHATAQREWRFAETLFRQYANSTGVFHASYCEQLDGMPEQASALLTGFEFSRSKETATVFPDWLQQYQQGIVETLQDDVAPSLDAETEPVTGGSGLLEDQSQCPFRAFAKRRLRVDAWPHYSLGLSAADRGSLLHDALYALWGDIGDHATLLGTNAAQREALIESAVSAAIASTAGIVRRQLGQRYWHLESQRLSHLLLQWLAVEEARGSFVVAHREHDIELALGPLQLRLRVDRIDHLANGAEVIIDYKSGKSTTSDWLGDRPAKPQLLLYSVAGAQPPAALAFAQVRVRDCTFVGLGETAAAPGIRSDIAKVVKERMPADDWPSLNAAWRQNLERLAAAFVAGEAQVDPLGPASCTYCGLQPLCRIHSDIEEPAVDS
tara:strand:+ start:63594 stop:66260 length:2667 start_codon:yes stop_codon:yes gene_type:complete